MRDYRLKMLTPEETIFDDSVISITVTCEDGLLTVLAGHAPMVVLLAKGPIVIKTEKETMQGATEEGVLRVGGNEATLLTRSITFI